MPKLIIPTDDFHLTSKYACGITETIASDGSKSYNYYSSQQPSSGTVTKSFEYSLPTGSEIQAMTLYATLGSPRWGTSVSTINGESVGTAKSVSVNIDVTGLNVVGTVNVPFVYKCAGTNHQHSVSEGTFSHEAQQGANLVKWYNVTHESVVNYTSVYLEIEYTCGVYLHHGENGVLVPYQLYRAENDNLVPYQLFNAVNDELIRY